ncbi:MAG: hypothetical protein ACYTEI_05995 [Planctomycetota bacterium]
MRDPVLERARPRAAGDPGTGQVAVDRHQRHVVRAGRRPGVGDDLVGPVDQAVEPHRHLDVAHVAQAVVHEALVVAGRARIVRRKREAEIVCHRRRHRPAFQVHQRLGRARAGRQRIPDPGQARRRVIRSGCAREILVVDVDRLPRHGRRREPDDDDE